MRERQFSRTALTIAAAASYFFVVCSCADIEMTGRKVNFSTRIASMSTETRTVYGEDSGTAFQYIDWTDGDVIRIFCDQCEDDKYADYAASHNSHKPTGDRATVSSSTGLKWGTGDHTFYAVYPSPVVNSAVSFSEGVMSAEIPALQSVSGAVAGSTSKVASPDMRYQYMVAKTVVSASASSVDLELLPLTTAIEFTVKNGFDSHSTMNVSYVKLTSDNYFLSGQFTVAPGTSGVNNRPICTNRATSASNKSVTINFSSPVAVNYGNTLNFTFFLNPGNGGASGINDITFEIGGTGTGNAPFVRRAMIKKGGVGCAFPTHKKTRVTGLMIPEAIEWNIEGTLTVTPWSDGINQGITLQ